MFITVVPKVLLIHWEPRVWVGGGQQHGHPLLLLGREGIFQFTWELLWLSGGSGEPATPSLALLEAWKSCKQKRKLVPGSG